MRGSIYTYINPREEVCTLFELIVRTKKYILTKTKFIFYEKVVQTVKDLLFGLLIDIS